MLLETVERLHPVTSCRQIRSQHLLSEVPLKNNAEKSTMTMFYELERVRRRPLPFEHYTSPQLWNDPHISMGMLEAHLDQSHDAASFRSEFIDRAVEWISSRFIVPGRTRICDFGCGPGLWTTRFAERGALVTGIDLSERSIHYARDSARRTGLNIRYVLGDYLECSLDDRFDLITMIAGDFSVLSPLQSRALLQTFRSLLAEGGTLLLDVASEEQYREAVEKTLYEFFLEGGFWSPNAHHVFTSTYKYDREKVICDRYTIIEETRAFEIYTWNQCYNTACLRQLFEENGFQITEFLSDVAGTPYRDDTRCIALIAAESS